MRVEQFQLFPQLDILLLFPLFKVLIAFCLGVELGETLATGTAHVGVVLVVDFQDFVLEEQYLLAAFLSGLVVGVVGWGRLGGRLLG